MKSKIALGLVIAIVIALGISTVAKKSSEQEDFVYEALAKRFEANRHWQCKTLPLIDFEGLVVEVKIRELPSPIGNFGSAVTDLTVRNTGSYCNEYLPDEVTHTLVRRYSGLKERKLRLRLLRPSVGASLKDSYVVYRVEF